MSEPEELSDFLLHGAELIESLPADTHLSPHPVAAHVPRPTIFQFARGLASVREEAVRRPKDITPKPLPFDITVMHHDMTGTLDGLTRHQYRQALAAEGLTVPLLYYRYTGTDAAAFVHRMNVARRELTKSQLAMMAVHDVEFVERGANRHSLGPYQYGPRRVTVAEQAEAFAISPSYVDYAKRVKADGVPELGAAVSKCLTLVRTAAEFAQRVPDHEKQREVVSLLVTRDDDEQWGYHDMCRLAGINSTPSKKPIRTLPTKPEAGKPEPQPLVAESASFADFQARKHGITVPYPKAAVRALRAANQGVDETHATVVATVQQIVRTMAIAIIREGGHLDFDVIGEALFPALADVREELRPTNAKPGSSEPR